MDDTTQTGNGTTAPTLEEVMEQLELEKAKNTKLANDNANLTKYNNDLKEKNKNINTELQSRLTEDEKVKQSIEEREQKYKELELKVKTNEIKQKIGKAVLDENLASELSSLFANGDVQNGLDKLNVYLENERVNFEKKIKEANLTSNPTPPPSSSKGTITQSDFNKMSLAEKVQLKNNDYELYKKLAK